MTDFWAAGISRCSGTWCSLHQRIQHRHTSSLTSFKRYTFHPFVNGVWKWFIHFGSKKKSNSFQKVSETAKCSTAAHTAFFKL
jgi:hypothetical protein